MSESVADVLVNPNTRYVDGLLVFCGTHCRLCHRLCPLSLLLSCPSAMPRLRDRFAELRREYVKRETLKEEVLVSHHTRLS